MRFVSPKFCRSLPLLTLRLFLAASVFRSCPVSAADSSCGSADAALASCSEPVIGEWDTWRYVLDDVVGKVVGNSVGGPKSSESDAIDDAVAALSRVYPCGLTYTLVDAPYTESAKILNWTAKQDAKRIFYAGFAGGDKGACPIGSPDTSGSVSIRRERRVRCPRGYGWLIRDNEAPLCIKD